MRRALITGITGQDGSYLAYAWYVSHVHNEARV
jgi:GDP-D-mannose dehydratase